jgi:hypothetical protein
MFAKDHASSKTTCNGPTNAEIGKPADIGNLNSESELPQLVVHIAPELVHSGHPPALEAQEKGCLASPYVP